MWIKDDCKILDRTPLKADLKEKTIGKSFFPEMDKSGSLDDLAMDSAENADTKNSQQVEDTANGK